VAIEAGPLVLKKSLRLFYIHFNFIIIIKLIFLLSYNIVCVCVCVCPEFRSFPNHFDESKLFTGHAQKQLMVIYTRFFIFDFKYLIYYIL